MLRVLVTHLWLHTYVIALGLEPRHSNSRLWAHPCPHSYTAVPRIFQMFQKIWLFPLQSSMCCREWHMLIWGEKRVYTTGMNS